MGNRWPACSCTECGELKGSVQPCALPGPCEWQSGCECEDSRGSQFFNDDDVLLERLEAAGQEDRLLAKLHVNVALFSTTSADIVEGLLRLTRQQQIGKRGEVSSHTSLHQGLQHHALPPISLMKALQWVYRVEEMPAAAAEPSRQCVVLFFSTMLAAAAALKWQRSPPAAWKRKGMESSDVLRTVESRLSEVISALRFLGCIALLQHCADPSLLGSRKTMSALRKATGNDVGGDKHESISPLRGVRKADTAWDFFFMEARRRPSDAVANLLLDLHGATGEPQHRALPGGPTRFSLPVVPQAALDTWDPQAALDTWDDELVFVEEDAAAVGGQRVPEAGRIKGCRGDARGKFAFEQDGISVVTPL